MKKVCQKKKYTQGEADAKIGSQLIQHLNNNKQNRRPQVHAYYCRKCKAWHTTTIHNPHLESAEIGY